MKSTIPKELLIAAEDGDTIAQCIVAGHYYSCNRGTKNLVEAERWWRLAAEKDNAAAQYCLGFNCYRQIGVVEAVEWIRKSADNGFCPAQTYLGFMYLFGMKIMPRDRVLALKWLLLGAERESSWIPKIFNNIVMLFTKRELVLNARRLASDWSKAYFFGNRKQYWRTVIR